MATYYSNQFAAAGTEVAAFDAAYRASQGDLGGHSKKFIARTTTNGTSASDVFRMFRALPSGSRIFTQTIQSPSTPTAGAIAVGLHLSGFNHDGDVVDQNLFGGGVSMTSGLSETDVFTNAALGNADRGKTLWELLGLTEDPNLFYDVTLTTTTGITTASDIEIMMVMELLFTD